MSPYESPSCLLYWSQLDKPICCWVKEVHIIIKCLSGFKHQQLHNDLKSRCIVLEIRAAGSHYVSQKGFRNPNEIQDICVGKAGFCENWLIQGYLCWG